MTSDNVIEPGSVGYDKHDVAGKNGGNSRAGTRGKGRQLRAVISLAAKG